MNTALRTSSAFLMAALAAAPGRGQTELYRYDGSTGQELGFSLAVIGDIDGDGADDWITGAPRTGTTDKGEVFVVSGKTASTLYTYQGSAGDRFGYSVAGPGDVDGDLIPDWVVGAPQLWYEPGCLAGGLTFGSGRGYARVYSGANGALLYTVNVASGYGYGLAIGTGGDIDDDGMADFILSGSTVRVISGVDGTLIREHPLADDSYSSTIVHNLNGTGKVDYAYGAFTSCSNLSGWVYAHRGPTGGQMWSRNGQNLLDEFGFSCISPGDLDGDGRPDIVAGGTRDGRFLVQADGMIRGLSGVDGSVLFEKFGPAWSARGYALAPLGDLGSDGSIEFAVSQPGVEALDGGKDVLVMSGPTAIKIMKIPRDDDTDRFGSALASGDVNGDGLLDLLVGARWDDDGGVDSGSVKVFTLFVGPTVYCEAQVNSEGCTPTLFATGQPSLSVNNFRVKATNVLNQKTGLMFWGTASRSSPFSGGTKCVSPPTRRTALQSSTGNPTPPADCTGMYSFHWNASYASAQGLSAGDDVYCQYWSRDPSAAGTTTNLTGGLAFTLVP